MKNKVQKGNALKSVFVIKLIKKNKLERKKERKKGKREYSINISSFATNPNFFIPLYFHYAGVNLFISKFDFLF